MIQDIQEINDNVNEIVEIMEETFRFMNELRARYQRPRRHRIVMQIRRRRAQGRMNRQYREVFRARFSVHYHR